MYSRTSAGSATPRRSDATPAHQIPDRTLGLVLRLISRSDNDMDPFNTSILPSTPFNPQTPRYEDAAEPGVYDVRLSSIPRGLIKSPTPHTLTLLPTRPSPHHIPLCRNMLRRLPTRPASRTCPMLKLPVLQA